MVSVKRDPLPSSVINTGTSRPSNQSMIYFTVVSPIDVEEYHRLNGILGEQDTAHFSLLNTMLDQAMRACYTDELGQQASLAPISFDPKDGVLSEPRMAAKYESSGFTDKITSSREKSLLSFMRVAKYGGQADTLRPFYTVSKAEAKKNYEEVKAALSLRSKSGMGKPEASSFKDSVSALLRGSTGTSPRIDPDYIHTV